MILVKHPLNLQELAFSFAFNLDIAYKIWSEFVEHKKDKTHLSNKDSIFNAVYQDSKQLTTTTNDPHESSDKILNECKGLFENHYHLAVENLKSIEQNSLNSDSDAIRSLESILLVMKSTI